MKSKSIGGEGTCVKQKHLLPNIGSKGWLLKIITSLLSPLEPGWVSLLTSTIGTFPASSVAISSVLNLGSSRPQHWQGFQQELLSPLESSIALLVAEGKVSSLSLGSLFWNSLEEVNGKEKQFIWLWLSNNCPVDPGFTLLVIFFLLSYWKKYHWNHIGLQFKVSWVWVLSLIIKIPHHIHHQSSCVFKFLVWRQGGIMSCWREWHLSKSLETASVSGAVVRKEHTSTVSGNIFWLSLYGKQYGGWSRNKNRISFLFFFLRSLKFTFIWRLTHYFR